MATEDGIELEGEPQDGQVIDVGDDGDTGGGEDQRAADAGDGDGKPNRRERQRQRQKEHEQRIAEQASAPLKAQLEMLQNQQNQQNQLIRDLLAQRQAAPAAPAAPAVDPIKKAVERMKNRAALIRDEDPATAERFFEEQAMIIREAAKEEAEATKKSLLEEMRKQPQQDPTEMAYFAAAPWLNDQERYRDVVSEAKRIAHREQKNLGDPTVKDYVVRRAIASVGQNWGLPVHGATPAAPALPAGRQSAVDGDGSRTITAAAGGGGNGLQGLRWTPQARANYEYLREQGIVKNEKEYLEEVVQPGMTTGKRRANV